MLPLLPLLAPEPPASSIGAPLPLPLPLWLPELCPLLDPLVLAPPPDPSLLLPQAVTRDRATIRCARVMIGLLTSR
jgi:hypothetical protein